MQAEKRRTGAPTKKVARKVADRAAAPRAEANPGLFGFESATPKAIADRAAETSLQTRAKAQAQAEAAATVDIRKPAVILPAEYVQVTRGMIEAIADQADVGLARERWEREAVLRKAISLDLKEERLLKASLDGRCNRVVAGVVPGTKLKRERR